jgi:hypothetical protein
MPDQEPRQSSHFSEKVIHLRYCRIVAASETMPVRFEGVEYTLSFVDARFVPQKGFTINRASEGFIPPDFLLWLSLYIGEDAIDPFQEVDTRFVSERGDFRIDQDSLQQFLVAAERAKHRRWPRWKRELFDNALIYFSAAVRSGVNMMPLNLGFFALSLECLGNVRYGKRDRHFTFGEQHFLGTLTARLAKLKTDPVKKPGVKAFEKRLKADVQLLMHLRNAFYGHSLLHLRKDRSALVMELRKWATRYGYSRKVADLSFKSDDLKKGIVNKAFALYKLGLRLNRLFLFFALGFSRKVPFATHDFQILADHRNDEVSEFRGIRWRFNFSQVPEKPSAINMQFEISAPDAGVPPKDS